MKFIVQIDIYSKTIVSVTKHIMSVTDITRMMYTLIHSLSLILISPILLFSVCFFFLLLNLIFTNYMYIYFSFML